MTITPTTDQVTALSFLSATFRRASGNLWLACMVGTDRTTWKQVPFRYPDDLDKALGFISRNRETHNLYVCSTLNENTTKRTEDVYWSTTLWADLDTCPPELLRVEPTVLVQTSPGRHQAWWYLDEFVPADVAVSVSHNIAKTHKIAGCDTDGGLGKMMRIPGTWNFNHSEPFQVRIVEAS